ncbi:AMP-binding protein [Reinekea blandensis]|uniref:Long-chain-fatty-acid--CoA ligase n=1 Tax=Reinekea blandensis MED297 TaxID=314283 RepID=A4BJQ3_9GAMM|nr:AMP-binding protein [Reinekea blandensis]EAR07628.1 Acyl-CoA synthetase (AMP-forming)/AMP-acid ligase II [Reinekea sp. MED297] [Reinekea blandensis MED297]
MTESYRHENYPEDMQAIIDADSYETVLDLFDAKVKQFADKPAFTCMGKTITYKDLDALSSDFAAYLQNETDLKPGDRIALQMPNIVQFPIAAWGALRAGLVVVNTNPLYTERELEHQMNDSGAKAMVVYAGMAAQALKVQPRTPVEKIIVTEIADLHPPLKRALVNTVVKRVKKMVPDFDASKTVPFRTALRQGQNFSYRPVRTGHDDPIVLQYTGGTTGVAKGAMLTNRNLIANMLQCYEYFKLALKDGEETLITPLPLYHIYAFTVHCMVLMYTGNQSVLIPNPRDIPGFVKELSKHRFTGFVGLNTLFVALCNNDDFKKLDFSGLKLTISGGMALTHAAADTWKDVTGCLINEGYGMTESSPVLSFNPPGHAQLGTIGVPAPSTEVKVINDDGVAQPIGEPGELCARGPQVMKGYWNRPQDTAKTIDEDGWLKTGDVAVLQEDGYLKIVDRKKDMIVVSGFNVYPNEIEDVLVGHPKIVECAAVGVPSEKTGEAVKVFIVTNDEVSDEDLIAYCREHLTAYKVPRQFERRDELPKTNVGKVLRRELRTEQA